MCRATDDPTCPGGRRCTDHRAGDAALNAKRRAAYAAAKAAKGEQVRAYRRKDAAAPATETPIPVATPALAPAEPAAHPQHPTVTVQDGWTVGLSADPKALRQREAAEREIGPEYRDADGQIIWARITDARWKSWRAAVERPAPALRAIPRSAVTADGKITDAARQRFRPAQLRELEDLVWQNFR